MNYENVNESANYGSCPEQDKSESWKIIIADDEKEVHAVTRMVLKGVQFDGKRLDFLSAYSGEETKQLIQENPDVAVILLDVVMEDDNTGLEIVKFIRNEIKNSYVRIILRTGQSGQAPEREIIAQYDINDYKEKTDLTSQKLFTTVTAGLRGYRDLLLLDINTKHNKEMKTYLQNIIKSIPSGIIVTDDNFSITIYNEPALTIFTHKNHQLINRNLFETTDFFNPFKNAMLDVLSSGKVKEITNITDREGKILDIVISPLISEDNKGIVIRIDDKTEIYIRDEQIKRMQKLETVGTLAAGLAHDFNNILGGISGATTLLRLETDDFKGETQDNILTGLETIEQSVERAAGIVKQLLSISRKQEFKLLPTNLNECITRIAKICQSTFHKSINIVTQLPDIEPIISSDSSQIEQVLLNLAINASHAMTIMRGDESKYGGTLTFSIEDVSKENKLYRLYTVDINTKYYMMSISDTGIGIPENNIQKIFDPFFTTKKKEQGTGLGLSMVYNIITQHNGFIDIDSTVGAGTTFKIYLPASQTASEKPSATPSNKLSMGTGTVLVCDDEEPIRRILTRMLKMSGYNVIEAVDGEDALLKYEKDKTSIDVVILDNQMPKLLGTDVFRQLKNKFSGIKVIFTSGVEVNDEIRKCLNEGAKCFIPKPYKLESLSRIVFNVINDIMPYES